MKISVQELLIVLAIVLIIFGPTQIPKLMKLFKKNEVVRDRYTVEDNTIYLLSRSLLGRI